MVYKVTKLEEQAYRLCHHKFDGLTMSEAATRMGLRIHIVRRLLKSMERKAPQLFPILTQRQYKIYRWYVESGLSQKLIAIALGTTQSSIAATIKRMKDKKVTGLDIDGIGDVVQYDSSMDVHIRRKF